MGDFTKEDFEKARTWVQVQVAFSAAHWAMPVSERDTLVEALRRAIAGEEATIAKMETSFDTGREAGAAAERAAIVEWLRSIADEPRWPPSSLAGHIASGEHIKNGETT